MAGSKNPGLGCPELPSTSNHEKSGKMQAVDGRRRQRAADMLVEARQAQSALSDAADMPVEAAQPVAAQEDAAQEEAGKSRPVF